jgi:hypothetical protein
VVVNNANSKAVTTISFVVIPISHAHSTARRQQITSPDSDAADHTIPCEEMERRGDRLSTSGDVGDRLCLRRMDGPEVG